LTIQDLRHQLRDADQDRFDLTVALARLVGEQKPDRNTFRTMGVIVAIAAAIGAAVSTAGAPSQQTPVPANSAVRTGVSPMSDSSAEAVAAETIQHPVRVLAARTVTRQATRTKPVQPARRPTATYRRPVPRPLSPAEFGRQEFRIAASR
jgi:hypothetical protein